MAAVPRPAIANVIKGEFCIGCGACNAVDSSFRVASAENGELRVLDLPSDAEALARADRVCPFASAPDEDQLGLEQFGEDAAYTDGIGRHVTLYAGWAQATRAEAGSGGLTRWLLAELLERGEVDYVVQVDQSGGVYQPGEALFGYAVHTSAAELLSHVASSAYYPVTLQGMFEHIANRPGRCAVTALPCFARAVRSVMRERPELRERIRFVSGVICGSLKSRRYADYLSFQMGVAPRDLGKVNFRGKSLSRKPSEKCVEVWKRGSAVAEPDKVARVQDLDGTRYDLGYFKYKGCDWCDDVLAETADIAFGDAWFPPYSRDPRGTNVVVVRNRELADILQAAFRHGEIELHPIGPEDVLRSQGGGLRHRRNGLAFRLKLAKLFGRWTPRKRVAPRWLGPAATVEQFRRVLIRMITRSPRVSITGRAMPAAIGGVLGTARVLTLFINGARRVYRRTGG